MHVDMHAMGKVMFLEPAKTNCSTTFFFLSNFLFPFQQGKATSVVQKDKENRYAGYE